MSKGSAYSNDPHTREVMRGVRELKREFKRSETAAKRKLRQEAAYRDSIFGSAADIEDAVNRTYDNPKDKRWVREREKRLKSDSSYERAKAKDDLNAVRTLRTAAVLEKNLQPEHDRLKKMFDRYKASREADDKSGMIFEKSAKTRKLQQKFERAASKTVNAIENVETTYKIKLLGPAWNIKIMLNESRSGTAM